jgi:DNA end-binding protein Ku
MDACSVLFVAATLWKGQLTFGLVSIPIRLIRAARAEKIHMHNVSRRTHSRVKQVFIPEVPEPEPAPVTAPPQSGRTSTVVPFARAKQASPPVAPLSSEIAPIPKQDLVRAFEHQKEKYVPFEPRELENIAPRNSTTMEILEFVRFDEVDPIYLETSYYVLPDKGGEKPFALLYEALRKTGHSAVAEVVMYRRDQVMLIRAAAHGLIGHTLFHDDEVRKTEEFQADTSLIKPSETELAIKLVESLVSPWDPSKFKDKYRARLEQAIAGKVATGAIAESPAPAESKPVVDIVAALKASLEQMKKPAGRENQDAQTSNAQTPSKKKRSSGH